MYDIIYEYTVGEFVTNFEYSGVEVFDVPDTPVVSYNAVTNVLACSGCNQGTVQWFQQGEPIDPPSTNNWEPVDNAFYHVEVTNDNGCSIESEELYVDILVVNVEKLETNIAKAYPNPSNNFVQVKSASTVFSYELFNNLGLGVRKENVNSDEFIIDVSILPSGIYHLKILTRAGWSHIKIQVMT